MPALLQRRHLRGLWPRTGLRNVCSSTHLCNVHAKCTDVQGRTKAPRVSLTGDALLALWKVERKQLKNIITVVIKCSLEIHGLFEAKEAEEGLDIRVKIGKSLEPGVCL